MQPSFLRRAVLRARHAYGVLAAHRYSTVAGTLAFFLITSVAPFLFWLTLLFGRAGGGVLLQTELFGGAGELFAFLKDNAEGAAGGASIFFLATTLWSSSGFFYHLRRSGEIVYGSERVQRGWRVRLSALLFTFGVLLFFAVAGALLFAGVAAGRFLSPWVAYPVRYALVLVVGFFTAWLLNAYICPYRISPADTAVGSAITALLWLAASAAFSVYLAFTDRERLYGALAFVIVFVLWVYWMMICFVAGAVYSRYKAQGKALGDKKF